MDRVGYQQGLELIGLGDGAREAVEHHARAGRAGEREAIGDDAGHEVVRDELAAHEARFDQPPEPCLRPHCRPQGVTGRDVR